MTTLPASARLHAIERPDAPAVVHPDGTWSWADLDRRATAIATALHVRGLGPGDRIGLALGGTALGIAGMHGVARAGVTAVLVHPRLTAREIADLMTGAGCTTLVIDPATRIAAPPSVVALGIDVIATGAATPTPPATATAPMAAAAPTTEIVVPTSGTTARPKLARLPLDRLAASAAAWNAFLPPAS
ncbi:MAG: AMP-binding protein, partial [Candidatus Limnocylindrales bacterium]